MPIYQYEAYDPGVHAEPGLVCQGACGGHFETVQARDEPALTRCPTCGAGCRRSWGVPASSPKTGNVLSNRNLAEKGFTKYEKAGDGHYEKVTGKGPDVIKR